ncbi:MAG: ribosome small subunit-dependent GTPase A [Cyclobacteriaceae bacterium]
MSILNNYGWNNFHPQMLKQNANPELLVGRVISIKGFKYVLISEQGEIETEISGKLMYGTEVEGLPKVGDWVLYKDYESMGYLIEVLPRINELCRKIPGKQTGRQVLAVNIDCAIIVQGLDHDFNLMRLDRYLVQLTACHIRPVVILNKADLVAEPDHYKGEVMRLKHRCEIYLCSTLTGLGINELQDHIFESAKTYILIGSSGVGKSSLLNVLMNSEAQKTSRTSDSTSKGKHTTTSRDLFLLSNGSLIIDTPGMREFGLTFEDGQPSENMFPGLQQFVSGCRFSDCKHVNEMGCGVIEALHSGALDAQLYESYIKLMKEQRRFEISAEEKKRLGKQWGKMTKEAKDHRKKYKY